MRYLIATLKELFVTGDFKSVEVKFEKQGIPSGQVKDYLSKFKKLRDDQKIKDPNEKNVDYWGKQDFKELKKFVDKLGGLSPEIRKLQQKNIKGAELVAENEDWYAYWIKSYEASKFLSEDTEWCIKHKDHYDSYAIKNNIYFYISKNRDKDDKYFKVAVLYDMGGMLEWWDAKDKQFKSEAIVKKLKLPSVKYSQFSLDDKSEEVQLEAVKQYGSVIEYIENPSKEVQLEAVKKWGNAIQYIKNPTEEVQLEAVKQDGFAIQFIKNPSEKAKQLHRKLWQS